MPTIKRLARPHIGKQPMRFYFRAQDIHVSLPGVDVDGTVALVWKRGSRRSATEPFPIKEVLDPIDGDLARTATTLQDLALFCTMFKNARSGAFEPKVARFSLMLGEKKLGTAQVDLALYTTADSSSATVELPIDNGNILVKMSISSHWLKNVAASHDSDDASSMQSFGSRATDFDDAASEAPARGADAAAAPFSGGGGLREAALAARAMQRFRTPQRISADSLASGASSSAVGEAIGGGGYTPMDSTQKARADAIREAAIEQRWADEEQRARGANELEELREELREVRAQLKDSHSEVKYYRQRVDVLSAENRVLRRDPRGGPRDAVIQQLEVELQTSEQRRSDMEEQLSNAFSAVIKELQGRVQALTAERDRLKIDREMASTKKNVFGASSTPKAAPASMSALNPFS